MDVLDNPTLWVVTSPFDSVSPARDEGYWHADWMAWEELAPLQFNGLALQHDELITTAEVGGESPWAARWPGGSSGGSVVWNNSTKVLTASGSAGLFRGPLRPGSVRVRDSESGYTLAVDDGQGSLLPAGIGVILNYATVDYETGEIAFELEAPSLDHGSAAHWVQIDADFFNGEVTEPLPQLLTVYWDRPDFADHEGVPTTLHYVIDGQETTVEVPWADSRYGSYTLSIPPGAQQFSITVYGYVFCSVEPLFWRSEPFGGGAACFDCTIVNSNQTLGDLRTRLARRLGFSAQATNLPPGAAELFDEFLISAQTFLYREYPALETRRIFQWQCVEGQRFYGLQDSEGNPCDLRFDPYKNIEGAYVIDEGGTWMPLVNGIKPTFYTSLSQQGLPAFYEIRQCLEIFPAPSSSGYSVAIKGHFGLQPFEADGDQTTIDSELVFLWALANALDYYQKPSEAIWQQAQRYLGQLVAGTHGSRRYIPGKRLPPPAIQPRPVGGWD